jgi:hypothetical protein
VTFVTESDSGYKDGGRELSARDVNPIISQFLAMQAGDD